MEIELTYDMFLQLLGHAPFYVFSAGVANARDPSHNCLTNPRDPVDHLRLLSPSIHEST